MQPPHPAMIAHSKLSYHVCFKFSRSRSNIKNRSVASPPRRLARSYNTPTNMPTYASPSRDCCLAVRISLIQSERGTMPHLRNFDTKPPPSYCYELRCDNRLESVANAHTAADLHVRPVSQTALVSRAVGAANDLRNTRCAASRSRP